MPKKLDECVKKLITEGKNEENAWAICKSQFKDKMIFSDRIDFDSKKDAISIRDGFQEYLGIELGLQPYDKIFKIYRSPETIKSIVTKLNNLPVTDDHIDLKEIPRDKILGKIESSEIVNNNNDNFNSTIAIKNKISFEKNMIQLLDRKNQLSLGYFAELKEHDLYDFEQVNITPHHLAIVEKGRCGDTCKFNDKEIEMPEDIKKKNEETKDEEVKKDNPEKKEDTKKDAKVEDEKEDKKSESDTKKETKDEAISADKIEKVDFKDTQEFKDAVMQYGNDRADIILKAKTFLGDNFEFSDKDNLTIMREVLAKEVDGEFKDEEVAVAFKMLKKMKDYSNFADSQANEWDKIKDKEI